MAHIVPIPHEHDPEAGDLSALLPQREEVTQDLHGVVDVGQPVDHRNPRVAGQLLHHLMAEGAGHDGVHPALQVAGRVLHRLPLPQSDVRGGEIDSMAAELGHPGLEGDAGPKRGLLEDQGQRLSAQDGMQDPLPSLSLEVLRQPEQVGDVVGRQIVQREQMPDHDVSSQ